MSSGWATAIGIVAGLALAVAAYARGLSVLRSSAHGSGSMSRIRLASFAGGVLALAVALVSPLERMSGELLSAHMVQHLLLTVVAPPLLLCSRPNLVFSASVSRTLRRRLRRAIGPARGVARLAARPGFAGVLAPAALLGWHLPPLYEAALRHEPVHLFEHLTFLGTWTIFWHAALQPWGRRRLARGGDVLFVLLGGLPGAALGALLAFATTPLYPSYAPTAASWGLSPLQDQQLAGAVMWIPAGLIHLGIASALFVGWLRWMEAGVGVERRPA